MKWLCLAVAGCGGGSHAASDAALDATRDADPAAILQTLTPQVYDFGTVGVGKPTPVATFMLTNYRDAAFGPPSIALAGANGSELAVSATTCTAALAPGATCNILVVAQPMSAGAKTAVLSVTDDAGEVSSSFAFTAVLLDSGVVIAPSIAAFSPSAPTQVLTVSNAGPFAPTLLDVSIAGTDAAAFAVIANTCGGVLPSGATCRITIAYTPSDLDLSAVATLVDDEGQTSVVLQGHARLPAELKVATGLVDFGDGFASEKTLTFTNAGDTASDPLAIALHGTDPTQWSIVGDACSGTSLAPGVSCNVVAAFTPTTVGAKTAKLVATDNASATASITLQGTCCDPTTSVAPPAHDSGS